MARVSILSLRETGWGVGGDSGTMRILQRLGTIRLRDYKTGVWRVVGSLA
jgi:hypothetical protein